MSPVSELLEIRDIDHYKTGLIVAYANDNEFWWSDDGLRVATIFLTPYPCFELGSIKAERYGNEIRVSIELRKTSEFCIQVITYNELRYTILIPREDGIKLSTGYYKDNQWLLNMKAWKCRHRNRRNFLNAHQGLYKVLYCIYAQYTKTGRNVLACSENSQALYPYSFSPRAALTLFRGWITSYE